RDRHAAIDVGAVTLKDRVLRDADENVQVARRRAVQADFALAGEADAGAVLDSGRDADRQCLLTPDPALAAARAARLFDDGAGAAARLALGEGVDADGGLLALERFLDGNFEVVAQIAAAARAAGIAAAAAHRPEHFLED